MQLPLLLPMMPVIQGGEPPPSPRSFENSLGYISLAISAYMDRDTVALPGCAKFFRASLLPLPPLRWREACC